MLLFFDNRSKEMADISVLYRPKKAEPNLPYLGLWKKNRRTTPKRAVLLFYSFRPGLPAHDSHRVQRFPAAPRHEYNCYHLWPREGTSLSTQSVYKGMELCVQTTSGTANCFILCFSPPLNTASGEPEHPVQHRPFILTGVTSPLCLLRWQKRSDTSPSFCC